MKKKEEYNWNIRREWRVEFAFNEKSMRISRGKKKSTEFKQKNISKRHSFNERIYKQREFQKSTNSKEVIE